MGTDMKYVVVSIYDAGYDFNVNKNGKPQFFVNDEFDKYFDLAGDFDEWLKEKYKDYDLIIVCEDGEIEILKDKTKEEK